MRPAHRPERPKQDTTPPPVAESAVRWGSAKPSGSTRPVEMVGELADLVLEGRR